MTLANAKKWEMTTLGSIAEFRNGINYNKDNFGRGIKVINVGDFQDYSFASYVGLDEINPEGIVRDESLLQNGDIIFVRSNGNRELIGRSLFIDKVIEPVTHSAFTIRLRFTSEQALPRFYAYLFRSSLIRQALSAQGNGTNISNLNQGILSNLPVPLPAPEIQQKIAAILSAYDALIENNSRRIQLLETMAQALYREWFVNFRFPGHEQVKLVKSPLGMIPEGWEVKTISDVLSILSGYAFKSELFVKEGKYGLVTIRNVQDGLFITECQSQLQDLPAKMPSYCQLQTGDILLSLTGNIGRVCFVYGENYLLNQRVAKLSPNNSNNRAFTYFSFRLSELQTKLAKISNGVAQQNLSPIETAKMEFLCPSEALLSKYSSIAEPIVDQILALFRRNQNLRQTRDLLLPKLISGEVDVSALDINTDALTANSR